MKIHCIIQLNRDIEGIIKKIKLEYFIITNSYKIFKDVTKIFNLIY